MTCAPALLGASADGSARQRARSSAPPGIPSVSAYPWASVSRRRPVPCSHGRAGVCRHRGAPPARVADPLLPDARLGRGLRGSGAGDVPASVAAALELRGSLHVPGVAVQDRDQRLPGLPEGAPAARAALRRRAAGGAALADAAGSGRAGMVGALPGSAARAPGRGAGGPGGRARDDRARVPGGHPAPAAAPARGADPARRRRLVGERDRWAAGPERRGGQERAAARAGDAARAAARAAGGMAGG